MFTNTLSQIRAEACVPEQLPHYVQAMSPRQGFVCEAYAAYQHEGHAVLVAYPGSASTRDFEAAAVLLCSQTPPHTATPPVDAPCLDSPLNILTSRGCTSVTVLSPFTPGESPPKAVDQAVRDCYWQLPLPLARPGVKLRNMLSRAAREVNLQEEQWTRDHEELVEYYLRTRPLPAGTRALFSSLNAYVNGSKKRDAPQAVMHMPQDDGKVLLLAARRHDASLAAFAVGDYSSLTTAFYMFAFRYPDAPPGTADLLLSGLAQQGEMLGHKRINLGLGINEGIGFFKKKWGAIPYLPYVETSWQLQPGVKKQPGIAGVLRKLLRRYGKIRAFPEPGSCRKAGGR